MLSDVGLFCDAIAPFCILGIFWFVVLLVHDDGQEVLALLVHDDEGCDQEAGLFSGGAVDLL